MVAADESNPDRSLLQNDPAWQLLLAVQNTRDRRSRIAQINEHLLVVEFLTGGAATTARAAGRISLTAGTACGVLGVVQATRDPRALPWALCAFAFGAAAGAACARISTKVSQSVGECRRGYRRLASRLMQDLP